MGYLTSTRAFTLVELLVVVLIVAILVAVAAPSFLGQTDKAHDAAAKSQLAIAYKNAKASSVAREGQFVAAGFSEAALATEIAAAEPHLTVQAGSCPQDASGDPNHIIIDTAFTQGDDIKLCNDPERRVWILTAVDGGPPAYAVVVIPEQPAYVSAVLADAPAAYWRLGASAVLDSSASGAHTLVPQSIMPAVAPSLISGADGSRSFVRLAFGDPDSWKHIVTTPDTSALSSSALTIEAWIQPSALDGNGGSSYYIADKSNSYRLRLMGNGRVWFTIMSSGGTLYSELEAPNGTIVVGGVYHIVATIGASGRRLYVNGALISSDGTNAAIADTSAALYVGSSGAGGGSNPFAGQIDELAIYGTALSQTRVQAHYNAGKP